eukprot:scaffold3639_cov141-Isochrysis_galbana.AAC.8
MFAKAEETMRGQVQSGIPMHQAQQAVTFEFNREVQQVCMKILQGRDIALIQYAKQGADALLTLQRAGALVPPWLLSRTLHRTVQQQLEELAERLDGTREQREYDLRARVVRTATQTEYNQLRPTPESLFDPVVAHVIRYACVAHGHGCREGPGDNPQSNYTVRRVDRVRAVLTSDDDAHSRFRRRVAAVSKALAGRVCASAAAACAYGRLPSDGCLLAVCPCRTVHRGGVLLKASTPLVGSLALPHPPPPHACAAVRMQCVSAMHQG